MVQGPTLHVQCRRIVSVPCARNVCGRVCNLCLLELSEKYGEEYQSHGTRAPTLMLSRVDPFDTLTKAHE